MWLIRAALRRPIATLVVVIGVAVVNPGAHADAH